jgi:hypothetical protein
MGVAATQDSTFDRRELGAQVTAEQQGREPQAEVTGKKERSRTARLLDSAQSGDCCEPTAEAKSEACCAGDRGTRKNQAKVAEGKSGREHQGRRLSKSFQPMRS